jgi:signal transduction histidine kinase
MQKITDNIFFLVLLAMIGSALLVGSFIFMSIYNSNKLLIQKRKLQEAELNYQKELLYAVIDSQEKERQRIGMDLHDEVGATLSALQLITENFISNIPLLPDVSLFSVQSKSIIDTVITSVRNISHDLSPLKKGSYDLMDAIEDMQDRLHQTARISMILKNESIQLTSLTHTVSLAMYRIIAELVNNTIKHARARQITLLIREEEDRFLFHYSDDGTGIRQDSADFRQGIGMKNIESRLIMIGAAFEMVPKANKGFEITISIRI